MGSTEKFCLRWNDFETNIRSAFGDLKEEKDFSDVTLVCADHQVEAHRVILAACSPFFKKVLRKVQHSHPLIYMKGVKFSDLEAVLSFVYHGEVSMAEADLNSFLAVAEELEVKGLTCGKNISRGSSCDRLQPNSIEGSSYHLIQSISCNHLHQSNSSHRPQNTAPPLPHNSAQVGLKTSIKAEVDLNNYIEKIREGANFGQFRCNICGHVSSSKTNLRRHVESQHFPGLFEYSCDQCEKNFNTMTKYRNHRRRHHSNMYSCDQCEQKFNTMRKYRKHRNSCHSNIKSKGGSQRAV